MLSTVNFADCVSLGSGGVLGSTLGVAWRSRRLVTIPLHMICRRVQMFLILLHLGSMIRQSMGIENLWLRIERRGVLGGLVGPVVYLRQ